MQLPENPEKLPIHFIVSTGRTGSTLLASMFNAHPNVISVSEETFVFNLYDGYHAIKNWDSNVIKEFARDFLLFSKGKLGLQFQFFSHEDLEKMLKEYKGELNYQVAVRLCYFAFFPEKDKSDIRAFVPKELILHNHLKKVTGIFPDAKFIILLRDPRDNVLIKIRRAERRGAKYNLLKLSIVWTKIYSLLLEGLSKYAPDRFILAKYETLVSDPENELKRLCGFLNLEYHPQMLEYDSKVKSEFLAKEKVLSEHVIHSIKRDHDGLTKKLYTDKIGVWKTGLGEYRTNLVWTLNGKLAEKLGYEPPENFRPVRKPLQIAIGKFWFWVMAIAYPKMYYWLPWWFRKLIRQVRYGEAYVQTGHREEGIVRYNK